MAKVGSSLPSSWGAPPLTPCFRGSPAHPPLPQLSCSWGAEGGSGVTSHGLTRAWSVPCPFSVPIPLCPVLAHVSALLHVSICLSPALLPGSLFPHVRPSLAPFPLCPYVSPMSLSLCVLHTCFAPYVPVSLCSYTSPICLPFLFTCVCHVCPMSLSLCAPTSASLLMYSCPACPYVSPVSAPIPSVPVYMSLRISVPMCPPCLPCSLCIRVPTHPLVPAHGPIPAGSRWLPPWLRHCRWRSPTLGTASWNA